jgi:hypothetical protein
VSAASPAPPAQADPFLSGESGHVAGVRLTVTRTLADVALDLAQYATRTGRGLDRLAAAQPPRSVRVLSLYRPRSRLPRALRELRSDRHETSFVLGALGEPDPALAADTVAEGLTGGKFENLNALLAATGAAGPDWTLVVDDDVDLPERFLDRFLALAEALELDMAQPAQSMRSHAAWRVTRRRAGSVARLTQFVEIGPVTAFSAAAAELMPFPQLRFGWGLDSHWAALARERGWRLGVLDALPIRHESQPVASEYTHEEAKEEARRFLHDRPWLDSEEAQRTLRTWRRVPRP